MSVVQFYEGENGAIYIIAATLTDDGTASGGPAYTNPICQEPLLHELKHHVQRLRSAYLDFRHS